MQEKILFTKNLKLATALATLGIPFRKSEPFVVIEDSDRGNQGRLLFSLKTLTMEKEQELCKHGRVDGTK